MLKKENTKAAKGGARRNNKNTETQSKKLEKEKGTKGFRIRPIGLNFQFLQPDRTF